MDPDELRKMYGDEYPTAIVRYGIRMPLTVETRFSRQYETPVAERKNAKIGGMGVSRFMDGSASMTAEQLRCEWSTWTEWERTDFCQEFGWLNKQADYPEMLRFIMENGTPKERSTVAGLIASKLPVEEAFRFLESALAASDIGNGSNIIQGIAITKHPDGVAILRKRLEVVWQHPALWNEDDFCNSIAHEAAISIQYLIALGIPPAYFEEQVRRLSEHACKCNRDSCRRWLSKHYQWLR